MENGGFPRTIIFLSTTSHAQPNCKIAGLFDRCEPSLLKLQRRESILFIVVKIPLKKYAIKNDNLVNQLFFSFIVLVIRLSTLFCRFTHVISALFVLTAHLTFSDLIMIDYTQITISFVLH